MVVAAELARLDDGQEKRVEFRVVSCRVGLATSSSIHPDVRISYHSRVTRMFRSYPFIELGRRKREALVGTPAAANRSLTCRDSRAVFNAALSFATADPGVFAGATSPHHE